ncbi:hypothetical protein LguiB_020476 [Lonicera macranthoides]
MSLPKSVPPNGVLTLPTLKRKKKSADSNDEQQHGSSADDIQFMRVSDTEGDSSDDDYEVEVEEGNEREEDGNSNGGQQGTEEDCDDKSEQGREDGDVKTGVQEQEGENGADDNGKGTLGRKRYELRKRTEVRKVTLEEKVDNHPRPRSPPRVLKRGMGTKKASSRGTSGKRRKSQVNNRRIQIPQENSCSDDSLLLDNDRLDLNRTTSSGRVPQQEAFANSVNVTHAPTISKRGGVGADIQPLKLDETVSFDDIGGLSEYIDQLKEMVFFPLLYPNFFTSYNITPPRGVLLCGPPGTGKTLIARALACAASKAGQKVSFYMRKGADVLSKWVGEAERQLKLLFDEAQKNQPSIIFFDEIDGLAPVRSSKQEQIHNSIVSTLLALMDGLESRGQVVLIGATNRVDSIDGALRRPGRFDCEFNFPLPGLEARAKILGIHTRKWKLPPSQLLKMELAAGCVGYCGADLKALCTKAAIRAFREKYPQVYKSDEKFLIDIDSVKVERYHFLEAMSTITPAAQRASIVQSRPLPSVVESCLKRKLKKAMTKVSYIFPHFLFESSKIHKLSLVSSFPLVYRPRLLVCGGEGVGLEHLAPAILHKLEKFPVHSLELSCLVSDPNATTPEDSLVHKFNEARRTKPSILYLPRFHLWWETAGTQLKAVLLTLVEQLPPNCPILLLGTSFVSPVELDEESSSVFPLNTVYKLDKPSSKDRCLFFDHLIETVLSIRSKDSKTSKSQKPESLPQLSKTPKPATGHAKHELKAKFDAEEHSIRQLRMCLRDVCNTILKKQCFSDFHYPVMDKDDDDEQPVIENPMDMATLLQRVDSQIYITLDAFLKDFDLILSNAKKYHGDDGYKGKMIVSKAHQLQDDVYSMLHQITPKLVELCAKIGAKREKGQVSMEDNDLENQRGCAVNVNAEEINVDDDRQGSPALELTKKKVCVSVEADCRSKKDNVNATRQSPNAAEVEAMKKIFVERTKGYNIPQLERLYTQIVTTLLAQINKDKPDQPSSIKNIASFLLQFMQKKFDLHQKQ